MNWQNLFELATFVYPTLVLLFVLIHSAPNDYKNNYKRALKKNINTIRDIIATSSEQNLRSELIEFVDAFTADWFNMPPIRLLPSRSQSM